MCRPRLEPALHDCRATLQRVRHAVFVIDGNDVGAYPSVEDAEASNESYDAAALIGYLDDGTRLELTADWDTYRCRMQPTNERDLAELKERLRNFLFASGSTRRWRTIHG